MIAPLTPSQQRTLDLLRDWGVLDQSAASLQTLADLYALRDAGLAVQTYNCAPQGVWRPVAYADVWGDAR